MKNVKSKLALLLVVLLLVALFPAGALAEDKVIVSNHVKIHASHRAVIAQAEGDLLEEVLPEEAEPVAEEDLLLEEEDEDLLVTEDEAPAEEEEFDLEAAYAAYMAMTTEEQVNYLKRLSPENVTALFARMAEGDAPAEVTEEVVEEEP